MININSIITFIFVVAVMVCTQVAIRTSTMYCVSLPLSNGEQEVRLVLPADNYNISFSTNLGNFFIRYPDRIYKSYINIEIKQNDKILFNGKNIQNVSFDVVEEICPVSIYINVEKNEEPENLFFNMKMGAW
jgi:hypothetical protein